MINVIRLLSLMIVMSFSSSVFAQVNAPAGLIPAGLTPGDTFFVVFRTDDGVDATLSAADLETFADAQAAGGANTGLVTGWTALIAHIDGTLTTTSAFGGTTDRPIYLVDGTLVANDRASMFAAIATPIPQLIDVNEDGVQDTTPQLLGTPLVWTGFTNDGAAATVSNPSIAFEARLGQAAAGSCLGGNVSNTTTWAASTVTNCNQLFGLYVLSPLLQVPVAAPVSGNASLVEW